MPGNKCTTSYCRCGTSLAMLRRWRRKSQTVNQLFCTFNPYLPQLRSAYCLRKDNTVRANRTYQEAVMSGHKRAKYRAEHHGALAPQGDKPKLNVNEAERHLSLIGGSALVLCGLLRGSASGLVLAAVGGGLIYRGATGHCHVYEALDV